ncbi:MAG: hypothetical protein ACRC5H_03825 [Treponemataceae bacterium]
METEIKEKTKVTKAVKITVFEVRYKETNPAAITLGKDLFDCLDKTQSSKERFLPLSNKDENGDNDFITTFTFSSDFLFGSFARLVEGIESTVLKTSLDKKKVSLNDMLVESSENAEGSIKNYSFFCIYKNLLAITNQRNAIKSFEIYVNWILEKNSKKNTGIGFYPKKNTINTIPIKEIKSVQISSDYINAKDELKTEAVKLTSSVLKDFFTDVKGKKDFDQENLVSAILTLQFKTKEINKEKALEAALKITDDDNIIITGKNGKRIKGSSYLVTAIRRIEKLKTGIFNEKEIETEMRSILKDVINDKVVN